MNFYTKHIPGEHTAFACGSDKRLTKTVRTEIELVRALKAIGFNVHDYDGKSVPGSNMQLNIIQWIKKEDS